MEADHAQCAFRERVSYESKRNASDGDSRPRRLKQPREGGNRDYPDSIDICPVEPLETDVFNAGGLELVDGWGSINRVGSHF